MNWQPEAHAVSETAHRQYEHPPELLYDGLLYEVDSSFIRPEVLVQEGYGFAIVVPTPSEEEYDDITQSGPGFLVYNGIVYIMSGTDPAMVDDNVLRVSEFSQAQPVNPPNPNPLGQTLPQPRLIIVENTFGSGGPITVRHRGVPIPRYPWTHDHCEYLFELIEMTMTQNKRGLVYKDFQDISVKLHEKFRGSRIEKGTLLARGNKANVSFDYLERTGHNIHSYAMRTKLARYEELKTRVLGA
ncbi:uncharacterized protein PAC_02536 [Phialocephala subalpina]|uniref:Uncharacterized protein n=1 Tax=Phialocephala subalpina TaxID=576137 RepID=A0A1L7WIR1_9HELO|nr:uncharacterized protein PAC_02536 [Phialocephala subalpina]